MPEGVERLGERLLQSSARELVVQHCIDYLPFAYDPQIVGEAFAVQLCLRLSIRVSRTGSCPNGDFVSSCWRRVSGTRGSQIVYTSYRRWYQAGCPIAPSNHYSSKQLAKDPQLPRYNYGSSIALRGSQTLCVILSDHYHSALSRLANRSLAVTHFRLTIKMVYCSSCH